MSEFKSKDLDITFMHLVKILKRFWPVVACFIILGGIGTLLITSLLKPKYEAK